MRWSNPSRSERTPGALDMNTPAAALDVRWRSGGMVWWRWSALVASGVTGIELLCLVLVAFTRNGAEFAWLAAPFLGFAFVAALVVDPLLIFVWLYISRHVSALRTRWWLVLFVLILCVPLLMAPRSWYEAAVAAPSVLGFLLPRFVVQREH
jgi:uncharacterized membrane-anchored protein YitT (DUF2179 family)